MSDTQVGLRFAGQENTLTLATDDGTQLIPDAALESVTVTFPFEITEKNFLGQKAPTFREFSKGVEVEFKFEHTDAAQTVAMATAMIQKARGEINDQFALSTKYVSPDGGAFRVILTNIAWEGVPLEMGGRTEFLSSTIKGKCSTPQIETV